MDHDKHLDTRGAARYLAVSASLLNKLRVSGGGPAYLRPPGIRRVLYRVADLDAWLAAGRRVSTSG